MCDPQAYGWVTGSSRSTDECYCTGLAHCISPLAHKADTVGSFNVRCRSELADSAAVTDALLTHLRGALAG